MGNLSPRPSKSYHEGFSNHLTIPTPNRSSWKKQLQILNETLHIRKFSRRQTLVKDKRSRSHIEENPQQSFSIQNFRDLNRKCHSIDQREMYVKKSLSLFTIKQPFYDATNREPTILNSNLNHHLQQQRRRSKTDLTTVVKRHSTYLPSIDTQQYHIRLSSNSIPIDMKKHQTSTNTETRRTIIQASTSELLRCLSEYLCSSCSHLLPYLDPIDCMIWIKSADRQLILQGWQEQVFVNPANIVFVYLIVRDTLTHIIPSATIKTVSELHSIVLTCLYLSFSYMGNEITYPLKPFVTNNETRDVFWQRIVLIMTKLSAKMLAINQNPKFFTECFSELKNYNLVH